jgi:hypothetical protein
MNRHLCMLMLGGFAFRPTLGGFAHARGLCLSTHARGLCLSTHARGLCLSTHARGLRSRSGASLTLGGFVFRPRSGALPFAHARGPRSRPRVLPTLRVFASAWGLRSLDLRSGAPPSARGLRSLDLHSGAPPSARGCALSTYARGLRPPDLHSGTSLFLPKQTRYTYTIYKQRGGTDTATGLVHGAAAPWSAL